MSDVARCRRRACNAKMITSTDAIGRVKYRCPACEARAAAALAQVTARVRELEAALAAATAAPPGAATAGVELKPGSKYHTCKRCPTIIGPRLQFCPACKELPPAWSREPRTCDSCEVSFTQKWNRQRRCTACSRRGVGRGGHPCRSCGATLRTRAWICPSCKPKVRAAQQQRPEHGATPKAVRAALAAGVLDSASILRFVRDRGIPASSSGVATSLLYLCQIGTVRRITRGRGYKPSTYEVVGALTP